MAAKTTTGENPGKKAPRRRRATRRKAVTAVGKGQAVPARARPALPAPRTDGPLAPQLAAVMTGLPEASPSMLYAASRKHSGVGGTASRLARLVALGALRAAATIPEEAPASTRPRSRRAPQPAKPDAETPGPAGDGTNLRLNKAGPRGKAAFPKGALVSVSAEDAARLLTADLATLVSADGSAIGPAAEAPASPDAAEFRPDPIFAAMADAAPDEGADLPPAGDKPA